MCFFLAFAIRRTTAPPRCAGILLNRRASRPGGRSSTVRCRTPRDCELMSSASPLARTTSAPPTTGRTRSGFWRSFKELGTRRPDRDLRGPLPDAAGAAGRAGGADAVRGHARGAGAWPATRPPDQQAEQLPTYNAYSIDGDVTGAAGLRQLRRSRRLRAPRAAGHLGQGRDRDRALRRVLARHQAQGGRRARRGRLPHLLRSRATTATPRATSTRRAPSARRTACSAAA